MVALVGPTGVGKTTLASLIPRFHDVRDGAILLDGVDIRDLTLESLRSQISMVLQDVFLFHGSVRENILFGRPSANDEEMIAAAKIANAHEFIMNLPSGYDTFIGERGMKLSGGQKQRLSIARAVLKDAPILILDEATSSVDTETELLIQQALERLMVGRTTSDHRPPLVDGSKCRFNCCVGRTPDKRNGNPCPTPCARSSGHPHTPGHATGDTGRHPGAP